jgi:hypothetical protein
MLWVLATKLAELCWPADCRLRNGGAFWFTLNMAKVPSMVQITLAERRISGVTDCPLLIANAVLPRLWSIFRRSWGNGEFMVCDARRPWSWN